MASAAEVASGIRVTFIQHGIVRRMPGGNEDRYRVGELEIPFSEEATQIFRDRQVENIAYNSANNNVSIYTKKRITKAELEVLPQAVGGVFLSYSVGHVENIGGAPVVAEYASYSLFQSPQSNNAYYTCGSSISPGNEASAGTLGALVRDEHGELFGLTNNHVIGGMNHTPAMMPILAPGVMDVTPGGLDPFTIGHHDRLGVLTPGDQTNINVSANLDAAIFKIKDGGLISSMQGNCYDTPGAIGDIVDGMLVEKVGRTTGHRQGMVVGKYLHPIRVNCENPTYNFKAGIWFDEVYIVYGVNHEAFSDAGDSGSLVVGRDAQGNRCAVGLLFAGGPDNQAPGGKMTLVFPIRPILESLGVTLVSGHHAS